MLSSVGRRGQRRTVLGRVEGADGDGNEACLVCASSSYLWVGLGSAISTPPRWPFIEG
jgi:hypothetical protein